MLWNYELWVVMCLIKKYIISVLYFLIIFFVNLYDVLGSFVNEVWE